MSISLNDHENRIKVLENKSSSGSFKTVTLFENTNGATGTLTLSDSLSKFDAIEINYLNSTNAGNVSANRIILTSAFNYIHKAKMSIYQGGDGASSRSRIFWLSKPSDTQLAFSTYDSTGSVFRILGIKWGGGYKLRNFITKIASLYQNILKTISLTILGGEVI